MNKLEAAIIELSRLNKEFKLKEETYKNERSFLENKIKNALGKKNRKDYDFFNSGLNIKASIVSQKKITFDPYAVEEKIDKELFNEICEKQYVIINYEGMVKYLKSLGAKPSEFKKYILCNKEIIKAKVDQLGELGDLSLDDLEGCYSVSESKSWVKITETEEYEE